MSWWKSAIGAVIVGGATAVGFGLGGGPLTAGLLGGAAQTLWSHWGEGKSWTESAVTGAAVGVLGGGIGGVFGGAESGLIKGGVKNLISGVKDGFQGWTAPLKVLTLAERREYAMVGNVTRMKTGIATSGLAAGYASNKFNSMRFSGGDSGGGGGGGGGGQDQFGTILTIPIS